MTNGPETDALRGIDVQDTPTGQVVTVRLGGDVDLHHSPAVRAELIRLAEQCPQRLVVDLSAVEYMDSSGVATLVETLQRVRRYRGELLLVSPNERVRSIFQIARLDSFFRIVDGRPEAQAP